MRSFGDGSPKSRSGALRSSRQIGNVHAALGCTPPHASLRNDLHGLRPVETARIIEANNAGRATHDTIETGGAQSPDECNQLIDHFMAYEDDRIEPCTFLQMMVEGERQRAIEEVALTPGESGSKDRWPSKPCA